MPLYTEDTFTKDLLPTALKKDTREIIEIAVMLGWKVHITSSQSVTIIAPNEQKKYHFGLNGRGTINHNRIRKDVVKFGDPNKAMVAGQIIHSHGTIPEFAAAASLVLPTLDDEGVLVDSRPEPKPSSDSEPIIVSSRPMLAKASEGKGYESQTTMERKWSDGTTDYRCATCEFTSPERLPVSRHFGNSHSRGSGTQPKPPTFEAEVTAASIYAPNRNRISALAETMLAMHNGVRIEAGTVEEIAREALTWVNQQSKHGTVHAAEREELTDGDVLNRIRSLLDDGSQFRALEELRQRDIEMGALIQRAEEAEALAIEVRLSLDAAEHRAEASRSTLKAFMDLASELATG